MSLVIQEGGLKGAVPRRLKRAVEERLAEVGGTLTPDQEDAVRSLLTAAQKLVHATPAGKQVDVQLLLTDAPFGGLELSVTVTAHRPRSR